MRKPTKRRPRKAAGEADWWRRAIGLLQGCVGGANRLRRPQQVVCKAKRALRRAPAQVEGRRPQRGGGALLAARRAQPLLPSTAGSCLMLQACTLNGAFKVHSAGGRPAAMRKRLRGCIAGDTAAAAAAAAGSAASEAVAAAAASPGTAPLLPSTCCRLAGGSLSAAAAVC